MAFNNKIVCALFALLSLHQVHGEPLFLFLAIINSFKVSSSPSTILQTATLTAELSTEVAMTTGDYFEITLPAEVSVSQGVLTCSEIFAGATIACTGTNQVIRITLGSSFNAFTTLRFQIQGFTNPSSTQPTSQFSVISYNSAGTQLEQSQLVQNPTLTATADTITTTSFVSDSNIVGEQTSAVLTFTTKNAIPAGGLLTLTFPAKWNPNAATAQQLSYFSSSVTCTGTSNVDAGASCAVNGDTLTLSSGFAGGVAASTSVAFSISQIRNPRSARTVTGITLSTQDSGGNNIDTTSDVTLTGVSTARSFSVLNLNMATTQQVGKNTVMQMSVSLDIPVDSGAYVVLVYPSDLPLQSQPINSILGTGSYSDPVAAQISNSGQSQTLPNLVQSYEHSFSGILIFQVITNPSSTKPIDSFQYSLYDSSDNIIAQATTGLTYTPTSGTLSGLAIAASNTEVFATTTWRFTLTLTTPLGQDSQIRITLPAEVSPVAGSCSPLSELTGVTNTAASCTIAGQIVTVQSPFSSANGAAANTQLIFKLAASTIINPITTAAITATTVETRTPASDGQYLVDTGSISNPFTLTAGQMGTVTVTPNPKTAYTSATYTISMTSAHPYPALSKIVITLPSEVTMTSTAASTTTCTHSTANLSSMQCSATSANTIEILTKFSAQQASNTVFTFTIGGIRNQRTTASTSSYQFQVTTEDGSAQIEGKTSGVVSLVTAVPQYSSFSVTPTSFVNSASTTYTFAATTSNLLIDGDKIKITPQTEVTNPTTPTCAGVSANMQASLTCILNGNEVIVTLDFTAASSNQLASGGSFSFSVAGYQNPSNTNAPTSNFSVLTVTSDELSNVLKYTGTLQVQTTTAATMIAHSTITDFLSTSSLVPSFTTTTYTFAARTVSNTPQNSVLRVYVPSEVTVGTSPAPACNGDGTGLPSSLTCTYNTALGYFEVSNAFPTLASYPPRDFTISITNLQNPATATPSSSFKLETRTSSGGLIDGLNSGMTVTVQCNAPCATCNANAPSECLSCISNLAPSGDAYLLQGNTCVTSCSAGYLLNSGGTQCDACTDNCFTCQGTLNFCTACTGTFSLKNNQCITDCGDGFFSSSNVCSACDSTVFCATCNTAATVCTSCISGKFLQGSNCQDACTTPGYVADSSNICQACTGNCLNCQNTVDNCIECAANFFNHGGSCVTSCPTSTTIQDTTNKVCTDCSSTCATCISTVDTCTSCTTGLVKNGSTCITQCPQGTTVEVSGECQSCSLTCATCESTTTNCLSCNTGLYLVTNTDGSKTCSTTCPTDQYISGDSCVSCPSGQTLNSSGTGCDGSTSGTSGAPVQFIIFPFLIAAFAMLLIALASKLYKGDSYFFSITVLLWAFIETAVILFQTLQALIFGSMTVFVVTLIALLFLVLCNILIGIIYCRKINKDPGFTRSKKKNLHCYRFIHVMSVGWNFRIVRLHYSRFFGADVFKQTFKNFQNNFAKPLSFVTISAMITVSLPIIILDMAAVAFWLPWGYQLTITCIESLIIEALMLVWIALEFKAFRDPEFGDKDDYEELKEIDDMNEEDRRVVFSKIIDELKNRGAVTSGFLPEDQGLEAPEEDCMSDIPENHAAPYLNERAEKRKTLSYPPSPRTLDQKLRDLHFGGGFDRTSPEPFMLPDNVYAESQPAQPLKKKGKTYIDSVTQTHRKKKKKVVNAVGELESIVETASESEYDGDELAMLERERNGKKLRKNQDLKNGDDKKDLLQIESPKGEKSRVMEGGDKLGAASKMRGSGGKEALEDASKVVGGVAVGAGAAAMMGGARSPKETEKQKKEREKREQEKLQKEIDKKMNPLDERLGKQENKLNAMILTAEEKEKKEKEDKKKKAREAQKRKKLDEEGEGAMGQMEEEPFVDSPVGEKESPRQVLGPQDHEEMDAIMKEHERKLRGEESKSALLDHGSGEELPPWEMTDKHSLKNATVPGGATTIGEPEHDLAALYPELENLELAPNYVDYDDIRGDFIRDQMGNVVITKNERGELVDKQGRKVNKLGYLVDDNDNVINSQGEKVDIIGEFEKDKQGNFKIIKDTAQPTTNGQPNFIDTQGRPVNDKGYLVDREAGHIMSSRGSIVAKKGDFDYDEDGDPILLQDRHGYPVDKEGRRVNQRGYLVDNSGNILNDENKVAVVNEELSSDQDLPVVIPTERPPVRKKTKNAVNQEDEELMKNIEAQAAQQGRRPREMDDQLSDEVEQHLGEMRPSSGSTSVHSLMEDTPSNYNIPNMRFEQEARMDRKGSKKPHFHPEHVDEEEESDEFDLEDDPDNFHKLLQPRRIKPKRYKQPGVKDKKMAAAYGGEARGAPIRRKLKTQNSKGQLRKPRNKLEGLTNSVSGFGYEGPIHSGLPPRGESSLMTGADPRHMMSSLEMDQLRDEEQYRKETLQALNRQKRKGKKGKKGKKRPSSRNSDLEKIYGNVEDFDSSGSEYTLFSSASKQTSRSKLQGVKKIRGLETIYLQRLDPARSVSNMRKNKKSYSAAPGGRIMSNATGVGVGRAKHPKFREMQDRFQDDPAFLATESEKDQFSMMSDYKQLTKLHPGSARAGFATGHPILQGGGHSGNVLLHPARYNDQGSSPRGQWM